MGKRLYVAKKYELIFGGPAEFNWQVKEFHNLMDSLGMCYSGDEYTDEFDVDTDQWEAGLEKLKTFDSLDKEEKEDIQESVDAIGYTITELIKVFQDYLNAYDKNNGYLHFCFI